LKLIAYFIKSFLAIVPKTYKKKSKKILFLVAIQSIADVVGLAAIVPVLMLAIDGHFLEKSQKLRSVYEHFDFNTEAQFLIVLIIFVFIFFTIKNWFAFWLQHYIKKTTSGIVAHCTDIKYRHFIEKEYEEIISKGTPDFINSVMNIPFHYATGMLLPFINLFSETLVVILFAFFAFYNPMVFLVLLLCLGPAIFLINRAIKSKIVHLGEISGKLREDALKELNIGISGLTEIKVSNLGAFFIERFVEKQFSYTKNEMRSMTYQSVPSRMLELMALLAIIILVIYGFFYCDNPSEVRILGALFVISIFRLIPAINRILVALMHLKIYKYTTDQLLEAANYASAAQQNILFQDQIKIDHLYYIYPNADFYTLTNINLTIKKGSIVGLTGVSGSGKTTLIKVLLKLVSPSKGCIYADNLAIDEKLTMAWQKKIGYVGQITYIFDGTIKENVCLGKSEQIDMPMLKSVLQQCGLEEFSSEKMLAYQVGENGIKLSEGQKQRLCLARVLYKKSEILILDETTSALDDETENLIGKTLQQLAKNKVSIIIIAHRKNILRYCDEIYEIKDKNLIPYNL